MSSGKGSMEAKRSRTRYIKASQVIAASLGLAGPVAAGAMAGQVGLGMAAALGGLAVSGDGTDSTFREQAIGLIYGIAAGTVAVLIGAAMAGQGVITVFCIPIITALASLIGGISRPLARATTKFILYIIIASHIGAHGTRPIGVTLLFFMGAVWTAGLSLVLRPLCQVLHIDAIPRDMAQRPNYPAKLLLRRWWKSLVHLTAWQYAIRITSCLAVAGVFQWLWPERHAYWVSITAVIVVHRNLQTALSRTLHRAAGTAIGVLLISVLMLGALPVRAMVLLIAVLASARPIFIETNYTIYAAVMTPLVILLLDFGMEPSWMVLLDRLGATLIGCALGLTLGYMVWVRTPPPALANPLQ